MWKEEVDFVVLEEGRPIFLIECKWSDDKLSRTLAYLKTRFPKAEAWQIHAVGKKDFKTPAGIRVAPAIEFLQQLI